MSLARQGEHEPPGGSMLPDLPVARLRRRTCIWRPLALAAVLLPATFLGPSPALAQQQLSPDEKAAVLLTTARAAFNDGNFPFAAEKFREFVQQFGGHPQVHSARFALGAALIQGAGDYQAALEPLGQAAG